MEPAAAAELLSQLQDGEFWVEEEEFLREFEEVTIGYPITEAGHLQSLYTGRARRRENPTRASWAQPLPGPNCASWDTEEGRACPRGPRAPQCCPRADVGAFLLEKTLCHTQALPGAWVVGQSAGGCRNNSCFPCNPKYWLRLSEPSELCVALLQRPRKHPAGRARALVGRGPAPTSLLGKDHQAKDYQAVGLHIWKVTVTPRSGCGDKAFLLALCQGPCLSPPWAATSQLSRGPPALPHALLAREEQAAARGSHRSWHGLLWALLSSRVGRTTQERSC